MQCAVFLLAGAFVFSRRPDLILYAHFYGEDGSHWYADAYNSGWLRALTLPEGGYLNTVQRLVGSLSLLVPLRYAPLVMNVFGLLIQVLPVFFLLSGRCAHWWPLRVRCWQAALYIVLPNTREVHILLTNAPFHFALLAFLVAVANPPLDWRWKIFDIAVLVICALSGPFCIILLPLVLVFWWLRRQRWSLVVAALLAPLVAVQSAELLFGGFSARAPAQLGATPNLFMRLLAGQVYLGSLWGENGFAVNANLVAVMLVTTLGSYFLVFTFWRGTLELRLFIAFAMLLLAASLNRPLIDGALPQWQLLAQDRSGRYWFFPMLAFVWSLLWCATQRLDALFRLAAKLLFLALLHGVIHDRRYPPFSDDDFQRFLQAFDAAPTGALIRVPDSPPKQVVYLKKR